MNRAQAVNLIRRGEFEWREPEVAHSVLVFEIRRMHAARLRPQCAPRRMAREEVRAIAERAIALLKETRERLDVTQLCRRLNVSDEYARNLRRLLDKLALRGEVKGFGHYRRTFGAP